MTYTAPKIEFARGDTLERTFCIKKDGQTFDEPFSEIYFTVKKSYEDKTYVIQKRMSTGAIEDEGEGVFKLYLQPKDTDGLKFGDYEYDIEFVGDEFKKTFCGKFLLAREVTYASNE